MMKMLVISTKVNNDDIGDEITVDANVLTFLACCHSPEGAINTAIHC